MEYEAVMIDTRSTEGMEEGGMKRDKICKESSGKERGAQRDCQFSGRVGIRVGMYRPPLGARPVRTA